MEWLELVQISQSTFNIMVHGAVFCFLCTTLYKDIKLNHHVMLSMFLCETWQAMLILAFHVWHKHNHAQAYIEILMRTSSTTLYIVIFLLYLLLMSSRNPTIFTRKLQKYPKKVQLILVSTCSSLILYSIPFLSLYRAEKMKCRTYYAIQDLVLSAMFVIAAINLMLKQINTQLIVIQITPADNTSECSNSKSMMSIHDSGSQNLLEVGADKCHAANLDLHTTGQEELTSSKDQCKGNDEETCTISTQTTNKLSSPSSNMSIQDCKKPTMTAAIAQVHSPQNKPVNGSHRKSSPQKMNSKNEEHASELNERGAETTPHIHNATDIHSTEQITPRKSVQNKNKLNSNHTRLRQQQKRLTTKVAYNPARGTKMSKRAGNDSTKISKDTRAIIEQTLESNGMHASITVETVKEQQLLAALISMFVLLYFLPTIVFSLVFLTNDDEDHSDVQNWIWMLYGLLHTSHTLCCALGDRTIRDTIKQTVLLPVQKCKRRLKIKDSSRSQKSEA